MTKKAVVDQVLTFVGHAGSVSKTLGVLTPGQTYTVPGKLVQAFLSSSQWARPETPTKGEE